MFGPHAAAERHNIHRVGWLRAAVLGANDGIVSTGSLIVGIASAEADQASVLIAGAAALVAGAMSMAAGEYVSVSSQSDTERADLARERRELTEQPDAERRELARIYVDRGVDADLALRVADQMMARDALAAHARDELGISEFTTARPLQAALTSALTFSVGAAVPLLSVLPAPPGLVVPIVATISLACLAVLGYLGAHTGAAPAGRPVARILLWGALSLAVTAIIGRMLGTVV